jgi:hypothetical protein
MAVENLLWGQRRVQAELARLGFTVSARTVARCMRRPYHGVHRVRIEIPDGIEFEHAEIGSATTRARGRISLDLKDSYGQFNLAGPFRTRHRTREVSAMAREEGAP